MAKRSVKRSSNGNTVKGHTSTSVHQSLPSIGQTVGNKTGTTKLGGSLGAAFPKIGGFNAPGKLTAQPY